MQYTCPMHPEVVADMPGKCPKCGMNLVAKDLAPKTVMQHEDKGLGEITWKSYMPLIVVIGLLVFGMCMLSLRDVAQHSFSVSATISYFMIGFFLVFAGFKLMDLKGFAEGYSTYDLLAQRWFGYGYIYPFIELFFAGAMIVSIATRSVLWGEVVIMVFSGIGVAIKIAKKEQFQCACLGTFLKVPLTTVTLIEDFGMAFLAALLLLMGA